MGEFDGRQAGAAAGAHIADVAQKWDKFVGDEPDRLMHLATQTGFILPSDQRYTRFLTPEQIDHFNQNMADNADLVRAHAEEYRQSREASRTAAGELDYKRYLGNADLDDPTGLRDLMLIGNEPGTKAEAARKLGLWSGGAREGVVGFGRQHGWTPAEIDERQRLGDRRFGYTPPAPAPGPANGGGPPAPAGPARIGAPMAPGFNPVIPAAPAPAQAPRPPVADTASAMSGVPTAPTSYPPTPTPSMPWSEAFSGRAPATAQPAGPPMTKQPGQSGALTPEQRRALILSLSR